VASGGALALEPPRATRIQPDITRIRTNKFFFSQKNQVEPAMPAMAQPDLRTNWVTILTTNHM